MDDSSSDGLISWWERLRKSRRDDRVFWNTGNESWVCQRCIAAILIHFVLPLASHWPGIGLALDQLAILYFIQIPWEHWPSAKDEWEILGKLSAALWELHSDGGHIGCWLPPWFAVNSPWLFPRILSHSCSIWCFPFSRASPMVFQWENPIEMGRIWGARCFPGQGVANPRGEEMRPAHAVPSPMKRPRWDFFGKMTPVPRCDRPGFCRILGPFKSFKSFHDSFPRILITLHHPENPLVSLWVSMRISTAVEKNDLLESQECHDLLKIW